MRFRLILLKDLPDYPKGTKFLLDESYCLRGKNFDEIGRISYFMRLEYPENTDKTPLELERENRDYGFYSRLLIPLHVINNPEWVKKEVAIGEYSDSKCPVCGSTKFLFHIRSRRTGDSYDGYYYTSDVSFECECGNIYNIYTGL